MKKILFNNRGFTMIEMLILSGILAITILGYSQYQHHRTEEQKIATVRRDYAALRSNIQNSAAQSAALSQSEDQEFNHYNTYAVATATPVDVYEAPPGAAGINCPQGCVEAIDALGNPYCVVSCGGTGGAVCPAGCAYASPTP